MLVAKELTDMVHCTTELNVTKVAGALCHSLSTSRALEVAIDRTESRIRQSSRFLYEGTRRLVSSRSPAFPSGRERGAAGPRDLEATTLDSQVGWNPLRTSLAIQLCTLKWP